MTQQRLAPTTAQWSTTTTGGMGHYKMMMEWCQWREGWQGWQNNKNSGDSDRHWQPMPCYHPQAYSHSGKSCRWLQVNCSGCNECPNTHSCYLGLSYLFVYFSFLPINCFLKSKLWVLMQTSHAHAWYRPPGWWWCWTTLHPPPALQVTAHRVDCGCCQQATPAPLPKCSPCKWDDEQ